MPSHVATTRHPVVIVEDDENTRARLGRAVEAHPELTLAATAGTVAEGRAALGAHRPAVLLCDLGLPDGSGIDLIREARRTNPDTLAMVITVFGDESHVVSAIEAGAMGYLLKDESPEHIGRSILEILAGGSPISPPIARHLLRRFRAAPPEPGVASDELPHLSEREHQVLTLIVKGFSYAEIAGLLGVSGHTVTTHVRSIYRKLEVHSRGEAVYEALQLGLVKLDE
jgi:DNA-binding NarL/FixJ family response regulator